MPSLRQNTSRAPRAAQSTRVENLRSGLRNFFTGRSTVGGLATLDGPKPPRLELAPHALSYTTLVLPHIFRTATTSPTPPASDSPRSAHTPSSAHTLITSRPITPNSLREMERTISLPQPATHRSTRSFVGVDPEEQLLADLAARGRRRRRTKRAKTGSNKRSYVLKLTDRKIRSKVIACCLSAMFLTIVLTIYLALALSNREENQEFHVLLILTILVTTIFFCHALISLCMVAIRQSDEQEGPRMSLIGPEGFANPPRPIRVALARDEEAAGIESEATKFPPPAYGLWRESVRVDPDRIFWQRNEAADALAHHTSTDHTNEQTLGAQRPPSYISEDGVGYVIEAAPRSIAPRADVPLPLHPSEHGRVQIPSIA